MPTWNDGLSVGVDTIDGQHKELFARADALLAAMRASESREQVEPLLRFLRDYCAEHFASEAKLMAAERYPERELHVAQHTIFTAQMERIATDFETYEATTAVAAQVHQLLCVWLVQHILEVDKALAQFLSRTRS
jgi:hemerythrin